MKNREELVYKLFIGKVSEVLGIERTTELLKEANEAFPRCTHNEGIDKKVYVNKEFTGLYCEKCDEVYCGSI
jgi:hypothetical protein